MRGPVPFFGPFWGLVVIRQTVLHVPERVASEWRTALCLARIVRNLNKVNPKSIVKEHILITVLVFMYQKYTYLIQR